MSFSEYFFERVSLNLKLRLKCVPSYSEYGLLSSSHTTMGRRGFRAEASLSEPSASQRDGTRLMSPAGQLEKLGRMPRQPVGVQLLARSAGTLARLTDIAEHLSAERSGRTL